MLIVEAEARRRVTIGALGRLELIPGLYAYVGSARGSGGLAARIAHHCRPAPSPHWHIDYLHRHTRLRQVWIALSDANIEHAWAEFLGSISGVSIPLARFGATDCACRAHLFRINELSRMPLLRRRLAALEVPVRVVTAR